MTKRDTIRNMKLFLFDMDGTLYLGDRLFDFTIPLLRRIKETGGKYLFMTNNSSRGVEDYIRKLKKHGLLSSAAPRREAALRLRHGIPEAGAELVRL